MPDRDVAFLDALRVIRRDIQQKIDLAGELPARFPGTPHRPRRTPESQVAPASRSDKDIPLASEAWPPLFFAQCLGWVNPCNSQCWQGCRQKRHQSKRENHGSQGWSIVDANAIKHAMHGSQYSCT